MDTQSLPTIVLVGRTNVGKSSLFNRLTESKQALITRIAGTTRDLNIGEVEWVGYHFRLIDTGGIDLSHPDDIEEKVIDRSWKEIHNASQVFLVTDAKEGLMPGDIKIAQQLREKEIDFITIANKADSPRLKENAVEFLELGAPMYSLSAVNGSGTSDMLDELVEILGLKKIPEDEITLSEKKREAITVTLAGIPNVGKSSLMNSLLGREEVIVSPQAHTTRESRDISFNFEGQNFNLVDTAGIRKPRKMRRYLQKASADMSLDAIHNTDWVIFVIDATNPKWGEQERYILDTLIKSGSSIIFAANKWDMLEDDPEKFKEFERRFNRSFGTYQWIPVIPIVAKDGWHVQKLLKKIIELDENRYREIPQSALDRLLKKAIARRRPVKKKGPDAPYIHTIKQIDTGPPTFEVVIQFQDTLAETYVRFLQKFFREKFDFEATPIRIYVRAVRTV